MPTETPQTIQLKDYTPPPYLIQEVYLDVGLDPVAARVASRLKIVPNPKNPPKGEPLVLDGEGLRLDGVNIDGRLVVPEVYAYEDERLTIRDVPQQAFTLDIVSFCDPKGNTRLSGLYISSGIYCTQCEAEGFRRITFFQDRPDVMARFTVRVEGPKDTCPVLLSNGNPKETGDIPGTGRHFAVWEDPHPKPAYLFALVAGDLAGVYDTYVTKSGRQVDLRIFVEKGKEDRCAWAMESLKTSMRWDEEAFGREYDLDVFMIVAVSDFNMGAMENKGLNVFNDKYILALPETATDTDYINVEAIIAHEYFHNWTGNRITCRDWFQLCLKEGLTVFRDQEFTADIRSRPVKRIADVRRLRSDQFPEDAGPLAHPVRPDAYMEINNFYTATVYEKGAELCRMMKTLIGADAFRKAMDLYFQRHDGEAATVEDFVACMADASGRDMSRFFRWYEQAGTPEVVVSEKYDAARKTFEVTLEQVTAPTPGQPVKQPFQIPLGIGLVGPGGDDMPLDLEGTGILNAPLIELTEVKQTFRFRNVAKRPVLSLNRGFSAPIRIRATMPAASTLFLMQHDSDNFNRWEAAQTAGRDLILKSMDSARPAGAKGFAEALGAVLADAGLDPAFKAAMLALPGEAEIASAIGRDVDPGRIHAARDKLRNKIGQALMPALDKLWRQTEDRGPYMPDPASTGRRALRHAVLQAIAGGDPAKGAALAVGELRAPRSMTEEIGALSALILLDRPEREEALRQFYDRHSGDHLLVDKWFGLHAAVPLETTAARVRELMSHKEFKLTTPNRVRGLVGTFAMANPFAFNAEDGSGYAVLADTIIALDPLNPQVAARIATAFRSWAMLEETRRGLVKRELERILATPSLSRDTFEIVSKSLKA